MQSHDTVMIEEDNSGRYNDSDAIEGHGGSPLSNPSMGDQTTTGYRAPTTPPHIDQSYLNTAGNSFPTMWNTNSPSAMSAISSALSNGTAYSAGSRRISYTVISEEFLGEPPVNMGVRYVRVPLVEEVEKRIPKREVVEVEKVVPKYEIEYVERLVEVPQIQYVDKTVEVEVVQDVVVTKTIKQIVDVPREVIKTVPKIITVQVSRTASEMQSIKGSQKQREVKAVKRLPNSCASRCCACNA